jgi:ATP-dependent Lon protease
MRTSHSRVPKDDDAYWEAAMRNLRESAYRLIELDDEIPSEAEQTLRQIDDPVLLTDVLAANLKFDMAARQHLLEQPSVEHRFKVVQTFLSEQLNIAELQRKLKNDRHTEMSESQKKAYLREQVRPIQKELGEDDGAEEQLADLAQRLKAASLPEKAKA